MTDGDKVSEATNFYIPSPSDVTYIVKQSPGSHTSSTTRTRSPNTESHHGMVQSSTSPELNVADSSNFTNVAFRSRANSAPSILYQQVALELRNISDRYCAEYNMMQVDIPVQNRRASMPALMQHSNDLRFDPLQSPQYHRPHSPGLLHAKVQSLRADHVPLDARSSESLVGSSSRRRNESISEENPDDDTWAPD